MAFAKVSAIAMIWTVEALAVLFTVLAVPLTIAVGPADAVVAVGSATLAVGTALIGLYAVVAVIGVLVGLVALPLLTAGRASSGKPEPPRPECAPSYDMPDVAWAYALVIGMVTEPDESVLEHVRSQLEGYRAERSRQLGRPVRFVGSMGWDQPGLKTLPRWVRTKIVADAPAHMRHGRRRLADDVSLIRVWQRTDYTEAPDA